MTFEDFKIALDYFCVNTGEHTGYIALKKFEEHIDNGYVYILWDYSSMPDMDNTRIKIGVSVNPTIRCNNIITQAGLEYAFPITYLKCKHNKCEGNFHKLLKEYRGIGEWFNISPFKAFELANKNDFIKDNFILEESITSINTRDNRFKFIMR